MQQEPEEAHRMQARQRAARVLRNPRHPRFLPYPHPHTPAAPRSQLRALQRRVLQRELRNGAQVHLVGPVGDAQRARAGPQARERRVAGHARAAVRLHRRVQRVQRGRGRQHLGRRDLAARLRAAPRARSVRLVLALPYPIPYPYIRNAPRCLLAFSDRYL
jgi:hypothetical protein